MSYYILVNDDDSLFCSKKERLMQRQKLVNELIFVVDPIYRGVHNMKNATVLLEYVLPVSRKYETVFLELCEERYNDCFLQYKLAFDTGMSSEAGSIEMQLTFIWTELAPNGAGIQRVRKTSSTFVDITPISAWSDIVPDSALSSLDERIIKLDAATRAINDYINVLENNKVDDLMYNESNETLHLTAKGIKVGQGVYVRDMLNDGIPVVDLDSTNNSGGSSSGGSSSGSNNGCGCGDCDCWDNVVEFGYSPNNNGCNCGCEDNVVEFGYVSGGAVTPEKPEEDDGIVEF